MYKFFGSKSRRPLSATTLLTDNTGLALIEFAFVMPTLVLIYIGSYQLCDAVSAQRKLTLTTRTLSDLTTQNVAVSPSVMTSNIFGSITQMMSPYDPSGVTATVSEVMIAGANPPKVNGNTVLPNSVNVIWQYKYSGGTTTQTVIDSTHPAPVAPISVGDYANPPQLDPTTNQPVLDTNGQPINTDLYVIVSQSNYTYAPSMGAAFIGEIPMSDKMVMFPRNSSSIASQ